MRRGFFGGTFNPPHVGHVRAAAAAVRQLGLDELILVPAGSPPHKQVPAGSPSGLQRLEMTRLMAKLIPNSTVNDLELRRDGPSYTADTLPELRKSDPDGELWLLCGTDMFETLPEWNRGEQLLTGLHVAVYPRQAGEEPKLDRLAAEYAKKYGTVTERIRLEPLPLSSTEVREALANGAGAELLPEGVYAYILKNRLYAALPDPDALWDIVYSRYKEKRRPHVLGCRAEAKRLAARWGADVRSAETAAVLHDITKILTPEEQLSLFAEFDDMPPEFDPAYPNVLHAFTGAAVAAREFGVSEEIASAIRWHTTGRAHMSLLEKIIWLSDFMEPTRSFEGVDEVRELAYRDLDAAVALALRQTLDFLKEKGTPVCPSTAEAFADMTGEISK